MSDQTNTLLKVLHVTEDFFKTTTLPPANRKCVEEIPITNRLCKEFTETEWNMWCPFSQAMIAAHSYSYRNSSSTIDFLIPIRILCLHGWLDNANSFLPLLSYLLPLLYSHKFFHHSLQNIDFELVCLDLPGCGKSQHLPNRSYHFVNLLTIVSECIVYGLGWTHFGLLSHSLGAGLSSVLAGLFSKSQHLFPFYIDFLITLDGYGIFASQLEWKTYATQFSRHTLKAGIMGRVAMAHLAKEKHFSTVEEAVKHLQNRFKYGLNDASATILVQRGTKQVVVNNELKYTYTADYTGNVPTALISFHEDHILGLLQPISCPCLILAPREGTGWPFDENMVNGRIKQLVTTHPLRNTQFVQVKHSNNALGHHFHMDYAKEVATEDIFPFLKIIFPTLYFESTTFSKL